ncbi:MAG: tetratricopeptide repeat protein [Gemmataceae bacterium]
MPRWCAPVVLLGLAPLAFADGPTPAAARQRWLRGNAGEARALYDQLAKDPKQAITAAIGISRIQEEAGEFDAAAATLAAALVASPDDPRLLARSAELAYARGNLGNARAAADKAIAKNPDEFLARYVLACVLRDTGDMTNADLAFRWFVKTYTARDRANKPISDPDELVLVALAGSENARWNNLSDQFKFILNEVYHDALKADPDLWMAEVQAGLLLLEKYEHGEANQAFDKALAINPRAAPALVGKGEAALQKFELKDAEKFAERALAINAKLPSALRLAADVHWQSGEPGEALKRLEQARAINPADEFTLGRIAACLWQMRRKAEFDLLCAAVEKTNPKAGRFYHELASALEGRRLYLDASAYYKKAVQLWPQVPGGTTSQGMLDMRLGREDAAKPVLTAANQADPFNDRVRNTLKVLRHLEKYTTVKTDHFVLRFDAKTDALLARYLADYLERYYERLSAQFEYRPPDPILVEIFNRHDMFSGRLTGLPDLHTIGASTGRMFALVSPKGEGVRKPFNWGRVVRHELVHVWNLEATNFQCPHWLTEGLAVGNEGFPRPPAWDKLLADRFAKNELLNLGTINLGFMRPRNPDEWTLAYAQASIYVDYAAKTHGPKAVPTLLATYKDGLDTSAAIRRACGVEVPAFEAGYKAYLREQIAKAIGKPPEKPLTVAQLEREIVARPDDDDLKARLAEQYLVRKRAKEARDLIEPILQRNAKNGLALFVKSKLLLAAGENEQAQALLETAADQPAPEPKALKALGKLYYDAANYPKAIEVYTKGRKTEPTEVSWLEDLAKVHVQTGDKSARAAVLAEIAPTDADDFHTRRELAETLAGLGRWEESERWAREAVEIDITDAKARNLLLRALREQKKDADYEKLAKVFGNKQP